MNEHDGFIRFEQLRKAEYERQNEGDLDSLDGRKARHPALQPCNPVHVLFMVEKVCESDHHQECTAEGSDREMRFMHDARIFLGLRCSENDCLDRTNARGDDHDQQREHDTHAENGDEDAPRQEALLPDRGHVLELVGINDGIIEGQRDFEDCEHGANEEHRHHTAQGPGRLPAEPGAEQKPCTRNDERPFEVSERACLCAASGHERTSPPRIMEAFA